MLSKIGRPMLGTLAIALSSGALAQENPAVAVQEAEEEEPEIVVQATRSGRRVGDEPVRVEVLSREEIEEKLLMRPGNIALILSETGGLRVQVTSTALGASNIRVQGMDGRYTQLLADGLPLYGGQASSLGLLQIAPTDLGQVEVIKGSVSALYGPSALGGVINLVSRRPKDVAEFEALLNATSRNGQDATGYVATPLSGDVGASLTGGVHRQSGQDLDADGWLDMPGYDRWTARPRLFWEGPTGATLYLTAGAMMENRTGGTLPDRVVPDGTPFAQAQRTRRFDTGMVADVPISAVVKAQVKFAGTSQRHRHVFGPVTENDRHDTLLAEASLSGEGAGLNWIGGIAWQADNYASRTFPAFNYRFRTPAIFGQVEHDVTPDLTFAGSGRLDMHNEFGTQFSPRLSLLYKPGDWKIRASAGRGFFAPTPFVEEIEAAGLSRLEPLGKLKAETATNASLDIGYAAGPIEANITLFGSNIQNATQLESFSSAPLLPANRVRLLNVPGTTRTRGTELLLRYRSNGFTVTGSYVYVDATEPKLRGGRQKVPLTPKHSAGLVGMWEDHDKGRIGVELYYAGKQPLDDNPYRVTGKPYFDLGLLGEIVLGKVRLFVNAENILNVRQSKFDPLLRRTRAADGRWTVDAWTSTEGFVVNGGIRLRFGGGGH
jgi:outer membrane receptor for ferrienterochelin and colicins